MIYTIVAYTHQAHNDIQDWSRILNGAYLACVLGLNFKRLHTCYRGLLQLEAML